MKPSAFSLVNASAYQQFRTQKWQTWVIRISLTLITLVSLFTLIFDSTVQKWAATRGELSITAQVELLKKIVNPLSVLAAIFFLCMVAYSAIRSVRLQGIEGRSPELFANLPEEGDEDHPFGPGFITTGVQQICVIKNYHGFLRVLQAVFPSQKDGYFFTACEKIDQMIDLQTRYLSGKLFCRTREGIPVVFPEVQVQYRFMRKLPIRQTPSSSPNSEEEPVRNYILQKGALSDQFLIRHYTDLVFSRVMRGFPLEMLNGIPPMEAETITQEKVAEHFTKVRKFKINALSKRWRNSAMLAVSVNYIRTRRLRASTFRSHRKRLQPAKKGIFAFSSHMPGWNTASVDPIPTIVKQVEACLAKELQNFSIQLESLHISTWQPAENGVNQKIQQTHQKGAELFSKQRALNARQIILASKNASLISLRTPDASVQPESPVDLTLKSQLLLKKKQAYRMPEEQPANDKNGV